MGKLNLRKGMPGGQLKEAGIYHLNKVRVLTKVMSRNRKKSKKEINTVMEQYKKEHAIYTLGMLAAMHVVERIRTL